MNMKRLLVLALFIAPEFVLAEDVGSALAKACMHKSVKWSFCKNAQDSVKNLEKSTLALIRRYDVEDPAAVLAFSIQTLQKGSIEIPQVIPVSYKNSLEVSSHSVYWEIGFNWP